MKAKKRFENKDLK